MPCDDSIVSLTNLRRMVVAFLAFNAIADRLGIEASKELGWGDDMGEWVAQ